MKRFLALFFIVVVSAFAFVVSPVAGAEEIYYVVPEGQEVYMQYARMANVNGEFTLDQARVLLPAGYTVKVVATESAQVRVTYCGLTDCFIAKSDLDKMTVSPSENALPTITVDVDGPTVYHYVKDAEGERIEMRGNITATTRLTYLGSYESGGFVYYAVRKEEENDVYYVLPSAATVAKVEAVLHPAANVVESKPRQSAAETAKEKEFTWVRFVLILGVIVPLITIVLMIVRPSARRRRQHREIYDDEDDYDGIDEV